MMKNKEEIKELEQGVLNKFDVVLTKEDEIMINQTENQNQLLDKIVKLQNTIEEIKSLAVNNNDENQETRRKRSNSFDDILPN
jgi:protein subunit release factor B